MPKANFNENVSYKINYNWIKCY